jgi:male-specific lethal 3
MICSEKQVAKIPADRSIIMILESFVKNYTLKILENHFKKRRSVIPVLGRREQNIDYNEIYNDINLAKEAMDGLRVYFNFIIKDFLLYTEEKEHFEKIMSEDFKITFSTHCKERARLDVSFRERKKIIDKMDEEGNEKGNLSSSSSISDPHEVPTATKFSSRLNPGLTSEANRLIEETLNWEMIPRLNSPHKEPAMIFGIYHLLRIFVKLPEFLTVSLINEQKMSILLKYLDSLIEFIEVEELGVRKPESYYIDA